jgi:DNA-binding NarL/FixJ family response regulator
MTKGNILIVEDEAAIAQDLKDIIQIEGYSVIGVAYSYAKAVEILAAKKPDLVFLDISLRGNGSGLDVASLLNSKYRIPFIFLTSFSDKETIKEVVSLNPCGYLIKPFKEKDIAPAIALAFVTAKKNFGEAFPTEEVINISLEKALSPQEYLVLKNIWKGKSNAEIAEELFVSVNTIKTHITKLYSKLDVNSRSKAINKALKF